ncbi:CLUMA_CG005099, isoform A [Clunio marinus]|uniref:CLUMA_CG005099, isoform A n=1 Tax=Clunio marinus TaxID=568069 RepID=A0A1J1HTV2_9DIPT|nr:CLUMA_CG005099, isoform A [Clunio marinus]
MKQFFKRTSQSYSLCFLFSSPEVKCHVEIQKAIWTVSFYNEIERFLLLKLKHCTEKIHRFFCNPNGKCKFWKHVEAASTKHCIKTLKSAMQVIALSIHNSRARSTTHCWIIVAKITNSVLNMQMFNSKNGSKTFTRNYKQLTSKVSQIF